MNTTAFNLIIYTVITVLTVIAFHFGWIDTTMETVVLTGTLGHLGLSYFPSTNTTKEVVTK